MTPQHQELHATIVEREDQREQGEENPPCREQRSQEDEPARVGQRPQFVITRRTAVRHRDRRQRLGRREP